MFRSGATVLRLFLFLHIIIIPKIILKNANKSADRVGYKCYINDASEIKTFIESNNDLEREANMSKYDSMNFAREEAAKGAYQIREAADKGDLEEFRTLRQYWFGAMNAYIELIRRQNDHEKSQRFWRELGQCANDVECAIRSAVVYGNRIFGM